MVDRDRGAQGDTAALAPQWMACAALNEAVGLAGVVASGRDRQRIELSGLDRSGDAVQRQFVFEQRPQWCGVEQGMDASGAAEPPQSHVGRETGAGAKHRAQVGSIHLGRGEVSPQLGDLRSACMQSFAVGGHGGAIDGAGRSAGDDLERRRRVAQRRNLADALEHTGLVGTPRPACGQCQSRHAGWAHR